jgi:tryptophan halogenase
MKIVNDVVILGGGTAGWLTAAYLSNNLDCRISIIDKEVGNPIGVGEATLLNFKDFLQACDLPVESWFNPLSSTYKSGGLFRDWNEIGKDVWHPFAMNYWIENKQYYSESLNGITKYDLWSDCQHLDFKRFGTRCYDLCVRDNKLNLEANQAFHVDCGQLVTFLKDALKNRINYIQSEMTKINRVSDSGDITSLTLKNGKEVKGDLFVDCSGFLELLKNKPIRKNLENRLICDTAVCGRLAHKEKTIKPYADFTAKEGGWIWEIPTQDRIGTGYVFNKSLLDVDDAMLQLSKHHKGKIKPEEMRMLDWKPFYNENFWHENVVSIGLSSGFIEPLESTGIALIMESIYQLATQIRENSYNDKNVEIYNNIMAQFFETSIDFVGSHYTLTKRTEPFWQEADSYIKISDRQKHYMDVLKNPDVNIHCSIASYSFQGSMNWSTWLIQQGCPVAKRNVQDSLETLKRENLENNLHNPEFGVDNTNHIKRLNQMWK